MHRSSESPTRSATRSLSHSDSIDLRESSNLTSPSANPSIFKSIISSLFSSPSSAPLPRASSLLESSQTPETSVPMERTQSSPAVSASISALRRRSAFDVWDEQAAEAAQQSAHSHSSPPAPRAFLSLSLPPPSCSDLQSSRGRPGTTERILAKADLEEGVALRSRSSPSSPASETRSRFQVRIRSLDSETGTNQLRDPNSAQSTSFKSCGLYSMRQREADLAAGYGSDEEEEIQRLYTVDEDGNAPWKAASPPSPSHQRTLSFESLDLPQLSDRWVHFINALQRSDPLSQEYIKREVRAGIPREIRGLYWQTVTGAKGCLEKNPDLYATLVQMPSSYEDKILKDVYRTMPHLMFFRKKDGAGQRALFNVLKAYSVLDKELGYCQSMSFIVAILLLYMPEQDAFWVLCQLTKVYHIRGFFQKGLPLLRLSLYQLERLMELELPQLYRHFKDEGVNPVLYASEWFSTLFSYNFPLEIVVRLWDVFLAEGNEYLFKIALAVLKLSHDDLLALPFEHVITYLKTKQDNLVSVSPEFVIKLADAYSRTVDKETLDSLEMRYNSPKKSIFRLETV